MGSNAGKDKIEPSEINNFKNTGKSKTDGNEIFNAKHRSTTDVCFFFIFLLVLTGLAGLLGYCILNGDIFRVINGYDNCGNICGKDNRNLKERIGGIRSPQCLGTDRVQEPYHIILHPSSKEFDRACTSDCQKHDGYRKFFNRCLPNATDTAVNTVFSKTGLSSFFSDVSEDFQLCWTEICYLCLIALVLSALLLVLFRYLVGLVVWIVLLGSLAACVIGTILLWIVWKQSRSGNGASSSNLLPDVDVRKSETYLAFAVLATIATVIISLIIFVMRNRIKLVVHLFQEAGKAIAVMPVLLFEPILTFVFLAVTVGLWFYFCLWVESAGAFTEYRKDVFYYQKDIWIKLTRWYNFFVMLWMVQFVIGCQHMVIAGAVSIWYFKRNKSALGTPVLASVYNLIRYHLGSVALGSFIIATIQFVRVILKIVEKYLKGRNGKCIDCLLKCCQCCLYCFEKILKYLTRNAYIEVAMLGYPFCKAGRYAFKLLSSNILRVAAINSVGDFVLFLGKAVVVIATVLIGIRMLQTKDGLQHMWVPVTLSGLFAYFVAHCFMTVYEMAIDTIFLCFCEDCEQNDGETKPYFMSRGLMEFVENSKKTLQIRDKSGSPSAENKNIPTISANIPRNVSG